MVAGYLLLSQKLGCNPTFIRMHMHMSISLYIPMFICVYLAKPKHENSLKAIANDSTSTPGDQDDFSNDNYSKVKGQEKRGYVRLVGRMPATESKDDSQIIQQLQSVTQTINQLQNAFNVMINVIQDHIPNANLSTILSNMNVQVLFF